MDLKLQPFYRQFIVFAFYLSAQLLPPRYHTPHFLSLNLLICLSLCLIFSFTFSLSLPLRSLLPFFLYLSISASHFSFNFSFCQLCSFLSYLLISFPVNCSIFLSLLPFYITSFLFFSRYLLFSSF